MILVLISLIWILYGLAAGDDWMMMMSSLIGFQLISGCESFRFSLKYLKLFQKPFEKCFPEFTLLLSFIRSISQISREVFLLVERIC